MTRPVAAYTLLTVMGAGLVAQSGDTAAQSADNLSPADRIAIAFCAGEAAKALGVDVGIASKDGKLRVLTPAPAPDNDKYDVCVIGSDGSLSNIYGRPDPDRLACRAAAIFQKCRAAAMPKAGS